MMENHPSRPLSRIHPARAFTVPVFRLFVLFFYGLFSLSAVALFLALTVSLSFGRLRHP
jgi:hypothetical protein